MTPVEPSTTPPPKPPDPPKDPKAATYAGKDGPANYQGETSEPAK